MDLEVSYRNMCRACMGINCALLPIYGDDTTGIKNLPEKLQEVTLIRVDRNDGLPQMLCTKCAYRTITSYNFRLQVQKTEEKFRKMLNIQFENVIDDDDDDGGSGSSGGGACLLV
ncbi:hypothetical protein M0804_000504 [Polistes exclamans]|nr:hypothetical protein M0804_000504 [Polistes exclamans]